MPSTPNRQRSLSIGKTAANARILAMKRHDALVMQVTLAAMYNALPAHLKTPPKKK